MIPVLLFAVACGKSDSNDNANEAPTNDQPVEETTSNGVFFSNLTDGDTVSSPFVIEMGVEGMIVEPKGPVKEGVGHHHLFINDIAMEEGKFIAADSTHIHYGDGQTSDTLDLEPGDYVLTLQFGNGMHFSYGEDWSATISVLVK